MPCGEVIVSLQDIEILFGPSVDGDVVTGQTNLNMRAYVLKSLGMNRVHRRLEVVVFI